MFLDTQGERLQVLGFHHPVPADRRKAPLAGPFQPLAHITSPRKGSTCQEACKQALAFQNTNTVQPVKKGQQQDGRIRVPAIARAGSIERRSEPKIKRSTLIYFARHLAASVEPSDSFRAGLQRQILTSAAARDDELEKGQDKMLFSERIQHRSSSLQKVHVSWFQIWVLALWSDILSQRPWKGLTSRNFRCLPHSIWDSHLDSFLTNEEKETHLECDSPRLFQLPTFEWGE